MKKKIIGLLSVLILIFVLITCFAGCAKNNEDEKIDLNSNVSKYLNLGVEIDPGTFKLSRSGSIYGVSGTGTFKIKVTPNIPLKCYGVSIKFSSSTSGVVGITGIEISISNIPDLYVDADGYATYSTSIKYKVTDHDKLFNRILFGEDETSLKSKIISTQTFIASESHMNDSLFSGNVVFYSKINGYAIKI